MSRECPTIVVYQADSSEGDIPDAMDYAAAMVPDGRPGTSWMATGATPDGARAKLVAMWERQYPGAEHRKGPRKKAAEPVEDVGIVI